MALISSRDDQRHLTILNVVLHVKLKRSIKNYLKETTMETKE